MAQSRTLRQMHALHFRATPDADGNGMAYGFARYVRNGQLVLAKDGGDRGFGSYLFLLPAHHLGVFLAANAVDTTGWMQDLERRLVARYFPLPPAAPPVTPPGRAPGDAPRPVRLARRLRRELLDQSVLPDHAREAQPRGAGGGALDGLAAAARPLAGLTCLLNLASLVALVLVSRSATATERLAYTWLTYGVPAFVYALLGLPLLSAALTVLLWVCGVAAWHGRRWSALGAAHYALVALGAVMFLLVLRDWNLLGIHV